MATDTWRTQLDDGDYIDCLDCDNRWFESVIVYATDTNLMVHFRGWQSSFDVFIPRLSFRIQPRFTHTKNWREYVTVGDMVEVKSFTPKRVWMWYIGVVRDISSTGHVDVTYGFPREYMTNVHIESDLIMYLGTHVRTSQKIVFSPNTILLISDNQKNRENTQCKIASSVDDSCCVCLINKKNVLILPCKHLCVCSICLNTHPFTKCPLCQRPTVQVMTVFV